tara:strand:- start:548 stop:916 length:369 start_codon:yes stop_codon:yes gene_type:complete
VEAIAARFASHINIVHVYIVDAHPADGWLTPENGDDQDAVCVMQPTTLAERIAVARTFVAAASVAGAVYIDAMDNAVELAYEARPEKLVVVDDAGCVVWKSGIGPYQYSPRALDAWLEARWG